MMSVPDRKLTSERSEIWRSDVARRADYLIY